MRFRALRAPGFFLVLRRGQGLSPLSPHAFLRLRRSTSAPDMFRLTKLNTSCTIGMPASLRSDGVRDHPGTHSAFLRNERSASPESPLQNHHPCSANGLAVISRTDIKGGATESADSPKDVGTFVQCGDYRIAEAVRRAPLFDELQLNQAGWIRDRQGTEEKRIDEREDRGVGADPEGRREDGGSAEGSIGSDRANCITQILPQLAGEGSPPHSPHLLLDQCCIT